MHGAAPLTEVAVKKHGNAYDWFSADKKSVDWRWYFLWRFYRLINNNERWRDMAFRQAKISHYMYLLAWKRVCKSQNSNSPKWRDGWCPRSTLTTAMHASEVQHCGGQNVYITACRSVLFCCWTCFFISNHPDSQAGAPSKAYQWSGLRSRKEKNDSDISPTLPLILRGQKVPYLA